MILANPPLQSVDLAVQNVAVRFNLVHFLPQTPADPLHAASAGRGQCVGLQRNGTAMAPQTDRFRVIRLVRLQNLDPVSLVLGSFGPQIPNILPDGHIEPTLVEFMRL